MGAKTLYIIAGADVEAMLADAPQLPASPGEFFAMVESGKLRVSRVAYIQLRSQELSWATVLEPSAGESTVANVLGATVTSLRGVEPGKPQDVCISVHSPRHAAYQHGYNATEVDGKASRVLRRS